MTTYQVPLVDDGTGGTVLEVRLTGDPVSWGGLVSLIEALHRAESPISVVFQPDTPPPVYMTSSEAARALGLTSTHIRRYVAAGILAGISTSENATGYTAERVIPYEDVLRLAAQAREKGGFPHVPHLDPRVAVMRNPTENAVIKVMRANGGPMTVTQVHAAVELLYAEEERINRKVSRNYVKRKVQELVVKDEVRRSPGPRLRDRDPSRSAVYYRAVNHKPKGGPGDQES